MAELAASEAGLNNDKRGYLDAVAGGGNDLASVLLNALAGGVGSAAPEIASSLASLPGSGFTPEQMAQIQVGTGTQAAGGTFPGLADTLANATTRTGMTVAGQKDIAQMNIDADAAASARGHAAFTDALDGINPAAASALDRLQGAVGPLNITSGYRDPEHNAQVGGAKGSQHIHGNAFDVDVSGMSLQARDALIRKARESGFQGIGVYDNSLHFDIGPERAWGPSYGRESLPAWATDAATSPLALDLLGAAGHPDMDANASRILAGLAEDLMDPGKGVDPRTLSAGGRSALLDALGENGGLDIVAMAEDMLRDNAGLSENDVLAHAADQENWIRGPGTTTDSWLPFDETTTEGPVTGLKPHPGAVESILAEAMDAIAKGASREAVIARLVEMGIDPTGL
jgi:hypothetical protein